MRPFNSSLKNKTFSQLDLTSVTQSLLIREYFACNGETHEFVITRNMKPEEMTNIVVHLEGEVEISRSATPNIVRRIEKAGNTSNDYVWKVAPRGRMIHRVITDTYRYYCITDRLFRKMKSRTIRFDQRQLNSVGTGMLVFVAMGSIEVEGKKLDAPGIFSTPEGVKEIVLRGEAGTLVLEIEKLA